MELFNRLRSRSSTELARQISENGPAPPPVETKQSLVSLSFPILCCVVWCMWCVCRRRSFCRFSQEKRTSPSSFRTTNCLSTCQTIAGTTTKVKYPAVLGERYQPRRPYNSSSTQLSHVYGVHVDLVGQVAADDRSRKVQSRNQIPQAASESHNTEN